MSKFLTRCGMLEMSAIAEMQFPEKGLAGLRACRNKCHKLCGLFLGFGLQYLETHLSLALSLKKGH